MRVSVLLAAFFWAALTLTAERASGMGRNPAPQGTPPPVAVPETPRKSAAGPRPRIAFERTEHDFGDSIGAEKIEHIFTFRNKGDADLTIDKVTTTCGCTAALLSAKVVPPGGTGEVKTTFTFGGRKGKQSKSIYVYSNDPTEPKVTLTLTGNVVPPVDVDPASLMLRDSGAHASRTVKIQQTMAEELRIEGIEKKLDLVETKLSEEPPQDGKKRYSLDISLRPDVPVGQHFESVTLITNSKVKPRIDIPVRISVLGDIQVNPGRIYLGSLTPGQEIMRQFTVANSKGKPFAVESVEVDNKNFSVSPQGPLKPAVSHSFTLSGRSTPAPGGVRAKITLRTDYPRQGTVEVTAYGYVRKEKPAPSVTPVTPTP